MIVRAPEAHHPSRRSIPGHSILMVVHGYPPRQTMGAELQAQRKARWWQAHGYQVSVLAADPQSAADWPFDQIEEVAESVEGIAVRRVRFAVPDATRSLRETYAHPLLAGVVDRAIARLQPDLLYQVSGYLFGILPLQIAARHTIPAALFAMDYWHNCQRVTLLRPDGDCCTGPVDPADCAACRLADRDFAQHLGTGPNRIFRQVMARTGQATAMTALGRALGVADFTARREMIVEALAKVALVVVNSQFLADRLIELGVPGERVLVERQGIDTDEFTALPPRAARQHGTLRALYLGQINHHKGADLAIEAVAQLRASGHQMTLRLHGPVTGSPAYLARLQERIATINRDAVAVHLEAALPRALVVAALRAADLLIVPSRWYENSPNVILEAFAAGTPVIAAAHGGMTEMIRDGVDGLLFQPGHAQSLAGALRRLLVQPALLEQLRAGISCPSSLDEEMAAEDARLARLFSPAVAHPGGM